jgi:leucyl aminopeptidase
VIAETGLPCVDAAADARPLLPVRPGGLTAFLSSLPPAQAAFLRESGFSARAQELVLLPGSEGVAAAALGLGDDRSPWAFGDLAYRLPEGTWRLAEGDWDADRATLGFCLGAYRYANFKPARRVPARLVAGPERAETLAHAAAIWMVRDLVNTPANLLGPAELADAAVALGRAYGVSCTRIEGTALETEYPTVAAVGRGSARAPVVVTLRWRGSGASDDSPLLSLCGKGVCFDSGGYDLKPSSAMLRMKKDMGGAATVLGIGRMLMQADLPLRLELRIGCVENSVSGAAMRPLDVLRTRRGLSVEVGNTDAEGRLVLCDLLAEASDAKPSLLIDCATLTGAARVATGPDLPALFCNDEAWAEALIAAGATSHDPVWRLPLWEDYDSWLDSPVADLNNVSSKPFAGAIVAALFLRRFVAPGTPWAHLDLYAWNDAARPGRPEGGEAQSIRGIYYAVRNKLLVMNTDRNATVT